MIEVSTSGSGGYRSIQEAVDAAGTAGDSPRLVLIRDGTYAEGARIERGWMRIAGESAQRVILKAPIVAAGGTVELENLQNGPETAGQNNGRPVPSLFLCGCREAVPAGPPRQGCHVYDETLPGGHGERGRRVRNAWPD